MMMLKCNNYKKMSLIILSKNVVSLCKCQIMCTWEIEILIYSFDNT